MIISSSVDGEQPGTIVFVQTFRTRRCHLDQVFSASVGFLAIRGHAALAGFDLIVESGSILNREIFVNELY
jgi:hypothetical protein